MANKKLNQLVSKPSIGSGDLFPLADATTGQLYKTTISDLGTAIGSGVSSVNTLVGAVVLDTDDIQELASPVNKWYTDLRARAALSAGTGISYNSGTGVITNTITQYTDVLARNAVSLTTTGSNGSATYNSSTGVLNVPAYTLSGLGGQPLAGNLTALAGLSYSSLGFITMTGVGTLALDTNTYLTTGSAASTYVPYSGATSSVNLGSNNLTVNNVFDGFSSVTASGTQIVLTLASVPSYLVNGSGGQTIKLPDATTLPKGAVYIFNNNQSSGTISVNNNSNTLIVSIPSGGYAQVELTDNANAAGSWDRHFQAPSNVSWSTNTFDYAGSITSATWNGVAVAINRGGTGATTSGAALTNLGAQAQLNGTGFVKIIGTTISYDNSTYLTTSDASSTYLALAGGTMTGNLLLPNNNTIGGTNYYIGQQMASNDYWRIYGNSVSGDKGEMVFHLGDNGYDFASGGQRYRFYYSNEGGGTASKDVLIIDYNLSTFSTAILGTSAIFTNFTLDNNFNGSNWIIAKNQNIGSGAAAGFLMTNNTGDLGAISLLSSGNSPANAMFIRTLSTNSLILGTNSAANLTILNGGAATFSNTLRVNTPNRSFYITSNSYSISDGTLSSGFGMDGDGLYLGNITSSSGWTISNPQVTIRSSGNVGIGLTNPSELLHLSKATYPLIKLTETTASTSAQFGYDSPSSQWRIRTLTSTPLTFGTNDIENARITSQGYFKASNDGSYMGISELNHELRNSGTGDTLKIVASNASLGGDMLQIRAARNTTNNSFTAISYYNDGASAYRFRVFDSGSVFSSVLGTGLVYSSSGNLTSTNPSDSRLKSNIKTITYGLKDILKLRAVSYNWKEDNINQGIQFGFIAQEVQEIMPDAIKEFGDETKFLGLEKDAIYATLVNAIQELKAELDTLKK